MSVKAPPPIEISRTPPSKVFSRSYLCLKVIDAVAEEMAIDGLSRRLSLTTAGSSTKAEFGAVSLEPAAFVVTHSGAGPLAFVAVQPAGRAGGVTPSKNSSKDSPHVSPVVQAL